MLDSHPLFGYTLERRQIHRAERACVCVCVWRGRGDSGKGISTSLTLSYFVANVKLFIDHGHAIKELGNGFLFCEGGWKHNYQPYTTFSHSQHVINTRIIIFDHTFSSSIPMLRGPRSTSHWDRRLPVFRTVSFGRPG